MKESAELPNSGFIARSNSCKLRRGRGTNPLGVLSFRWSFKGQTGFWRSHMGGNRSLCLLGRWCCADQQNQKAKLVEPFLGSLSTCRSQLWPFFPMFPSCPFAPLKEPEPARGSQILIAGEAERNLWGYGVPRCGIHFAPPFRNSERNDWSFPGKKSNNG